MARVSVGKPVYRLLGNPCIDVSPDGRRQLGGAVYYSARQAEREGFAVRIVCACTPALERSLRDALPNSDFWVTRASKDTVFQYLWDADGPQRVCSVGDTLRGLPDSALATEVTHVAPILDEIPDDLLNECAERGGGGALTASPQGLLRQYDQGGSLRLRTNVTLDWLKSAMAIVVNKSEYEVIRPQIRQNSASLVVSTDGPRGASAYQAGGLLVQSVSRPLSLPPGKATGAGDIFSAALFCRIVRGVPVAEAVREANAAAYAFLVRDRSTSGEDNLRDVR